MISGEVEYLGVFCQQASNVFDHLHVRLGPVTFAELPDIDDIAVEDERLRLDAFEIGQ